MDVYEKLRKKMDQSIPITSPATESKVEIEFLKSILAPDEAEIVCLLSGQPEDSETISKRSGMETKKLKTILEKLVKKGAIFKVYKDEPLYSLVPMMPGIFEFQLGKFNPHKAKLWDRYYTEKLGKAIYTNKTPFFRIVPINKSIPTELNILTYEEVDNIINKADSMVLATCICRDNKKMMGEGCDKPIDDICMFFDSWADYFAENGMGRKVTKEEGKKALKRAEEAGLVHSTMNVQQGPLFICNCCGCCCMLLRGFTQLHLPIETAKSNFIAKISEDECTGCGACVEFCQVKAIELGDSVAVLDKKLCIGCGVCASNCPVEAITMARRKQTTVPPSSIDDLMVKISQGKV
ncbi:MAG: 4Fe-4S binding protein [Thermodesulfobacteriota bacterium]|jgi:NAD-dependent dihydropyrimidine dehydrogenase PreA subunit|nr:MAG: 4Fe-4S binding protein [Thermodesulfobacteriota bacterium]